MSTTPLASRDRRVRAAIAALAGGELVVAACGDSDSGEVEGVLVAAAECVRPDQIAFMVRHTSGFLCVPMNDQREDHLDLPPMDTGHHTHPRSTILFAVSVDARDGITTGISAEDRARTIRLLAASDTRPGDLTRPGHVVPARAHEAGGLGRLAHPEIAHGLAALAGRTRARSVARPDTGWAVYEAGVLMSTHLVCRTARRGTPRRRSAYW